MYIYIFTWKQNWKHLYQMWTALCLSYAILWNVICFLARVLPCNRLHGGSLSFSVKAPPSSSILNLFPGLTYSCFLLLWILQRYYIIWRSKASMWGLNNMFCFGFFYNISYSRNHMFWCLTAMYPSYSRKHWFSAEEVETCLGRTVGDTGIVIDVKYRSQVELREREAPDRILPWRKPHLWTLCVGGWCKSRW